MAETVFDKMIRQLKDLRNLAKAGAMAVEYIRSHITHGNFSPLSPVTAAYRGAGKPLQDTRVMLQSITYQVTGANTVTVGTTAVQARLMNDGGVVTAKKKWLFIPGPGMRGWMRKYGPGIGAVLDAIKARDNYVFRKGRTICYRAKHKRAKDKVAFYLCHQITVPARPFFYLTDKEVNKIMEVCTGEIVWCDDFV